MQILDKRQLEGTREEQEKEQDEQVTIRERLPDDHSALKPLKSLFLLTPYLR